jgi:hypothetical protein
LRRPLDDATLEEAIMAVQEERIAVLETMINEHALTHVDFRESMILMEQRIDARFDRMDDKISRLFTWTVGIQITVLLAVVGSLMGLIALLVPR